MKTWPGQCVRRRSQILRLAAGLGLAFILAFGIYQIHHKYRLVVADLCGIELRKTVPSPDAKAMLVAFEISCGATTPFSTQVSMVPTGATFSRERYPPFFAVEGRHDLSLAWAPERRIEIVIPRNQQVYRQEPSANDIPVTYK